MGAAKRRQLRSDAVRRRKRSRRCVLLWPDVDDSPAVNEDTAVGKQDMARTVIGKDPRAVDAQRGFLVVHHSPATGNLTDMLRC